MVAKNIVFGSLETHVRHMRVNINKYLGDKIVRQILDTEIRNKHHKKKRLLQQVKNNTGSLKNKIRLITKIVLYRKVKLIIKK